MAITQNDLFVLQRGGQVLSIDGQTLREEMQDNFDSTKLPIASDTTLGGIKVGKNLSIDPSTGELEATVPDAFTFKGPITATADAPGAPAGGDLYIFTTGGTLNSTWGAAQGTDVAINDGIVWDADHGEWDVLAGMFGMGVTSVNGTAPIEVSGDASSPVISILPATASAAGSMSAADKDKLDKIKDNADIGTVTEVTSTTDALSVALGTTTPQLTIRTATASVDGIITLADDTAVLNGASDRVVTGAHLKVVKDDLATLANDVAALETTEVLGGDSVTVNVTTSGGKNTYTVNADAATKSTLGAVQLATDIETLAGTDDTKALTPADAKAVYLPRDFSSLSSV